jgi:hypothetical protein
LVAHDNGLAIWPTCRRLVEAGADRLVDERRFTGAMRVAELLAGHDLPWDLFADGGLSVTLQIADGPHVNAR